MASIMLDIYLTGLALYIALHVMSGSFTHKATIKVRWLNNRKFRMWGAIPAVVLGVLWPIVLPTQLYQNR